VVTSQSSQIHSPNGNNSKTLLTLEKPNSQKPPNHSIHNSPTYKQINQQTKMPEFRKPISTTLQNSSKITVASIIMEETQNHLERGVEKKIVPTLTTPGNHHNSSSSRKELSPST
jgi:hypothetical protein